GRTLATGSFDRSIRLWNADGTPRTRFDRLGSWVWSMTFTADSRRLLFTRGLGESKACSVLDLASGREQVRFTRGGRAAALSPDGGLAATGGGDNHEMYLWRTADAAVVARLGGRGQTPLSAAWNPDGKSIAWGNGHHFTSENDRGPLEHSFRLT